MVAPARDDPRRIIGTDRGQRRSRRHGLEPQRCQHRDALDKPCGGVGGHVATTHHDGKPRKIGVACHVDQMIERQAAGAREHGKSKRRAIVRERPVVTRARQCEQMAEAHQPVRASAPFVKTAQQSIGARAQD